MSCKPYKCPNCGQQYQVKFWKWIMAPHMFDIWRWMKCPACGKRSWAKRVKE